MLELAGIRTDIFTPHSTRVAPTTKVVDKISLNLLLQTAGRRSHDTFVTSYHKKVQKEGSFSVVVLFCVKCPLI